MMQLLQHFPFTFLCCLSLFAAVHSLQCNDRQYEYPVEEPSYCCYKCPPGTYMIKRQAPCDIECERCQDGLYNDVYTVDMTCKYCSGCEENMEHKFPCNRSHNDVCICKTGYQCKDEDCKECVPIPSTPSPTLPPPTTVLVPAVKPETPSPDMFQVLVIVLMATVTVLVVMATIKLLHWIRAKLFSCCVSYKPKTYTPQSMCCTDGDVSKPVQEAGNVALIKSDPELGLIKIPQTDI